MTNAAKKLACLICLVSWLTTLSGLALADGPSRPARPQEKDFHTKTLSVLAAALPAGPQGWEQVQRIEIKAPSSTIPDAEKYPWRLSARVAWQDTKKLQAAESRFMAEAGQAMQAQSRDAEMKRLQQRQQELATKLGQAMKAQNQTETASLFKQMEENGAAMQKHMAGFDKKMGQAQEKHTAKDAKAVVSIEVNTFSREFYRKVTAEAPLRGRPIYRSAGEWSDGHIWRESETWLFLGPWRFLAQANPPRMEATPRPKAPYLSVQTMIVRVEAEPARARAILEALDWKALEGLVAVRP